VDADNSIERLGEETIRIVITQVGLLRERQFRDILHAADISRLHALRVERLLIERHAFVHPRTGLLQALVLKLIISWRERDSSGFQCIRGSSTASLRYTTAERA